MTNLHAQHVAGQVRAEMARKRVTQQALATGLKMSQAAVSRRLRGDVPFDVAMLADVADLLGVSVSALTSEVAA